jgi:uncharacterized protein YbjT (DUF2867 family)
MGARLIPRLRARGHNVRVLARSSSAKRVPDGATAVVGDALVAESVAKALKAGDTLIHLVGTSHPSPRKAAEFQRVDLPSIRASVDAGKKMGIAHIVYVSVAQPAPVMHAYVAVRAQGEALIRESGIPATVLRPWYVVGPGHRWALVLTPLYGIAKLFPPTRDGATRLGLVTLDQMVAALISAVESPPRDGVRIVEVPDIRKSRLKTRERESERAKERLRE